jgi:PadR family transcriptional regulator PadR
LYASLTEKLLNTNTKGTKIVNPQKEVQVKLMKGLLEFIILQFLSSQSMHGYQVITKIRKTFGVYFGPSTIYPLLATLEKKGFVNSEWNMKNERSRKVYKLTTEGQNSAREMTHFPFFIVLLRGSVPNLNFVRFAWNYEFPKCLVACF